MIQIESVVNKPLLENTYIVSDNDTSETVIIDPGGSAMAIINILEKKKLKPKMVLYTHLHLDHIAGGKELSCYITVPSYAFQEDLYLFDGIEQTANFLGYPPVEAPVIDSFLQDCDELEIGSTLIKVIHTPGHTPGCCCFLIDKHLFSGDTLFRDSVGRTDLPGSDSTKIEASIQKKLYVLPNDTQVYPGHGAASSIGYEKENNLVIKAL